MCVVYFQLFHRVNDIKFCPIFYRQDLLSFDSLSRDWIIKLDPNDISKLSLGHDSFE